jgi:hypothetical protein
MGWLHLAGLEAYLSLAPRRVSLLLSSIGSETAALSPDIRGEWQAEQVYS